MAGRAHIAGEGLFATAVPVALQARTGGRGALEDTGSRWYVVSPDLMNDMNHEFSVHLIHYAYYMHIPHTCIINVCY